MIYGYVRVSTYKQDYESQKQALLNNGAEFIYEEKQSGKDLSRTVLQDCIENLQPEDILMVNHICRLSRSMSDCTKLINDLHQRNIYIKILSSGVDTSTTGGKMFAQMHALFAEFEREIILERTAAGREKARKEGRLTGRPIKHTLDRIRLIEDEIVKGCDIRQTCKLRGVSVATYYRRRAELFKV